MGMEFSQTKNVCMASPGDLADQIAQDLPHLKIAVTRRAKSLGGALGSGKVRNTQVMQKRLNVFKLRKNRFQRVRRTIGAQRTNAVIRSGGTAALVYGLANTGVSNTTLLAQRRAVAAAASPGGAGNLELSLLLVDGSMHGCADPAFSAHEEPITMWAEAMWMQWLPRSALRKMVDAALRALAVCSAP
eukprot:7739648-Karenia_brevis.AAC.1